MSQHPPAHGKKLHSAALFLVTLFVAVHASPAPLRAAGPEFIVTWRADSYVPPGFSGKALPTGGSAIAAAASVIDDGRLADLANTTIFWYANGEQVAGGKGVARVSFTAPVVAPNTLDIRAQIPDYRESSLVKTVSVPIMRPEIVLVVPPPSSPPASSITFEARPFFFSVARPLDLLFTWLLNGERVENKENPDVLTVTLPSEGVAGGAVIAAVKVVNPLSFRESASAGKTVSIPRQ